jgi:putative membrane protein
MAKKRWPSWVYADGDEPDYRFSFANERTFLAWIRTALALIAAGVAVDAFELPMEEWAQHTVAAVLVVLGALSAVSAWTRWARAERAMRRGAELPAPGFTVVLSAVIVAVGLLVLALGV